MGHADRVATPRPSSCRTIPVSSRQLPLVSAIAPGLDLLAQLQSRQFAPFDAVDQIFLHPFHDDRALSRIEAVDADLLLHRSHDGITACELWAVPGTAARHSASNASAQAWRRLVPFQMLVALAPMDVLPICATCIRVSISWPFVVTRYEVCK